MTDVESAIDMGDTLAGGLGQVGVSDLEALRTIGARDAWNRLRDSGLRDCPNSRLALEGAVRGVRWTSISKEERERITSETRSESADLRQ